MLSAPYVIIYYNVLFINLSIMETILTNFKYVQGVLMQIFTQLLLNPTF